MARSKDRDEDIVSIASSNHSRKRKRVPSPLSDTSDSDIVTVKKSKGKARSDSDDSSNNHRKGKGSARTKGRPSPVKKGKSSKYTTTEDSEDDDDDDSEEEVIVVASSKATSATIRRPSPTKSVSRHREEKRPVSKPKRVSQVASDNDEEVASRTSSHKSAKTSSSKASTSTSSRRVGDDRSRKPARERLESMQIDRPESSRRHTDILGDHNFAPSKSVSPVKAYQSSYTADNNQDAIKIKRLTSQTETLKRKLDESDDRFNEASSRSEELQAQVKQLEHQLKQTQKRHDADVAKVRERFEGTGEADRATQARIEQLEHDLMVAAHRHDEVTLALQSELRRTQRELQAALGEESATSQPAWMRKAEMKSTIRADELETQLRQQKIEYEGKLEALERQLALQQVNPQLAAKEREIDAIRLSYSTELDKRNNELKTIKTMYQMDKQAWASFSQGASSNPGLPASEDIVKLQRLVATLNRQLKEGDLRLQAVMDTYEARIKEMERVAKGHMQKNRQDIDALESSRATLEFDRSRFQGQVVSLKREREKQERAIEELRRFRLEFDRLRVEFPALQAKYAEQTKSKATVYAENESLKQERLLLHAKDKERESKMDEYIALLQAGSTRDSGPSDLSEKYKLLKSTYSMEREKYKRKIKKLERKLAVAQGDPITVQTNGASSYATSATPATSTSEEEGTQAGLGRKHQRNDDATLEDMLFNDHMPVESSRRPKSRVAPRSPSPFEVMPSKTIAHERLHERLDGMKQSQKAQLELYELAKPTVQFPPTIRERKADAKVPRHRNRVYVRSECHTPYVPDEMVSDSDDEFLEWESQAYAKSQANNPDRQAALVNTCWNRHILDIRCNRVRSSNLHFCIEFVESYGPLISSRDATPALLKHILKLVDLGQLTADEGGTVIRSYHQAV